MSQDQDNLDLMEEGIAELEGEVSLETALANEKVLEKAEKAAAKIAEKEAKAAERAAAKQAKLDEKALKAFERESAKAERLAKKNAPRILQEKANGITKPKVNSDCGKIWDLCTRLSNEKGELVLKKEVSASPLSSGFHPTTVGVQYYKWKKFYGIA